MVLSVIVFVPTLSWDDVVYRTDDVPCTVKLPVIVVDPDMVWLPTKVFDPVVAIAPIPVVFCTIICDDPVTHPGYCSDDETVPPGNSGCTCPDAETTPDNLLVIEL